MAARAPATGVPPARVPTAIEILLAVQALAARLERIEHLLLSREARPADADHERLLAALADAMEDYDLPFAAGEVLGHARVHHELDEALRACRATTTAALGTLLREMRDRDLGGLRVLRDGRLWRLARTSCT